MWHTFPHSMPIWHMLQVKFHLTAPRCASRYSHTLHPATWRKHHRWFLRKEHCLRGLGQRQMLWSTITFMWAAKNTMPFSTETESRRSATYSSRHRTRWHHRTPALPESSVRTGFLLMVFRESPSGEEHICRLWQPTSHRGVTQPLWGTSSGNFR